MVYAVRVSCHVYLDMYLDIYLDIHLNIHLDIYLDIYLDINLNVHLHLYLTLPYLRLTSPLTASRPPLQYLAPQSVNAIRVHSLVLPSSSTVNLRS